MHLQQFSPIYFTEAAERSDQTFESQLDFNCMTIFASSAHIFIHSSILSGIRTLPMVTTVGIRTLAHTIDDIF